MAVIAAITTTALDPQVAAQVIPISAGNNVQPIPAPVTLVAAPEPVALQTAPRATGHAI